MRLRTFYKLAFNDVCLLLSLHCHWVLCKAECDPEPVVSHTSSFQMGHVSIVHSILGNVELIGVYYVADAHSCGISETEHNAHGTEQSRTKLSQCKCSSIS